MNGIRNLVVLASLLCCLSFGVLHHGWANYDQSKPFDGSGTITESTNENPHASIKLKTKDKTWTVILAPVSRMETRGVTADMVKKGETVRVVAYPHKEGKDEMRAERILVGDKKFELR